MGRKIPISFNLRKYVDNHCKRPVVSLPQNKKTRQAATDYIVPDLIDFLGDD